ncbi:hypothetical protein ABID21_002214 [Pseudorhizobium tarimense]|uniref:Transposase n=1 Tax=Pseudorhizobium tarimense TaxID=1079109 RepID=A0ABV2H6F3_9HYPH|nr:hypothetical protein [Pseudorhizobium tarimense]MCJ8519078.1 hypothetical protein [Pseudorhizobium tarimense]
MIKTTTIPGLAFAVQVEEVNQRDASGGYLCYLASLYRLDAKTSERHLIRRSRIPGAADEMRHKIQRDGIEAFHRFRDTA